MKSKYPYGINSSNDGEIVMYFNVHDIVKLKIQTNIKQKIFDILAFFREFKESFSSDENDIDIAISDYYLHPRFREYMTISESSKLYLYKNNWLDIPQDNVCFNLLDKPLKIFYNTFSPLPLTFLMELILLDKGYTFIHAASVEKDGEAYLFPAFPGAGKTFLVSLLLKNREDCKLLGDDLVIINKKEVLSFPRDFAVYPYHLDILRVKDKNAIRKLTIIKLLNTLYNSKFNKLLVAMISDFIEKIGFNSDEFKNIFGLIKASHARIPPRELFSNHSIGKRGDLRGIYYLSKVSDRSLSKVTIEEINATELARICTYIMLHEWGQVMSILTIYCGLSEFSLYSFFTKINDLLNRIFAQHRCYQIKVPIKLDYRILCDILNEVM
jgi:hypothetical protein